MTIFLTPTYHLKTEKDNNTISNNLDKFLLAKINNLRTNKNIKEYKKKLCDLIKDYLDSTGYFNFTLDTNTYSDAIILEILKRCVIRKENIIFLFPLPKDKTSPSIPPPPPYPSFYNAGEIKRRADEICQAFTASGYPFASVITDIVSPNSNPNDTVEITYYIEPDNYYLFTHPILKGDFKIKKEILLKDIEVKPQEPFSHLKIEKSLQRLNSRNYISVANALLPVIPTSNIDNFYSSKGNYITIPFLISDKYGMGLDGAIGFSSSSMTKQSIYGKLKFDFVNLFHRGETAHFSYSGDLSKQEIDIEYLQPWILMQPLIGTLDGRIEVANEKYGYFHSSIGILFEPSIRWYTGLRLVASDATQNDSINSKSNTFIGSDIVILKSNREYEDKKLSFEFSIVAGSGFSKQQRLISRSHIDFKSSLHLPLPLHTALVLKLFSGNILTRDTTLTIPEMYQIGGSKSIRGYLEKEFPFTNVIYTQNEYHFYFRKSSSLYLFCDVGVGGRLYIFNEIKKASPPHKMLGYGIGIKSPTAIGTLYLELARNIFDSQNILGRIHIRFQSLFSSDIDNIFSK